MPFSSPGRAILLPAKLIDDQTLLAAFHSEHLTEAVSSLPYCGSKREKFFLTGRTLFLDCGAAHDCCGKLGPRGAAERPNEDSLIASFHLRVRRQCPACRCMYRYRGSTLNQRYGDISAIDKREVYIGVAWIDEPSSKLSPRVLEAGYYKGARPSTSARF